MLSAILDYFQQNLSDEERPGGLPMDRLHLASAALLIEVAKADYEDDPREIETVVQLLRERFEIPERELEILMTLADQEVKQATDVFQFTSLVNQHFSAIEKNGLVESLWEVAYADGRVHHYEEHLIRKIAELIYVPHSEFIRGKLNVAERVGASPGAA